MLSHVTGGSTIRNRIKNPVLSKYYYRIHEKEIKEDMLDNKFSVTTLRYNWGNIPEDIVAIAQKGY